jgi:hypothetical protein
MVRWSIVDPQQVAEYRYRAMIATSCSAAWRLATRRAAAPQADELPQDREGYDAAAQPAGRPRTGSAGQGKECNVSVIARIHAPPLPRLN